MELNRYTFVAFNIDNAELLAEKMMQEVISVPEPDWHFDEFRNCKMLSIFNPGGDIGKVPLGKKGEFRFTQPAIDHCPTMIKFLEENVLNWMNPAGRVTILRTPPGHAMNEHIDCTIDESACSTRNKWRFVLNGEIDKLFFIDQSMNKVYIPKYYRCYILDGGHPHNLEISNVEKFTICVGSPWTGEELAKEYKEYLNSATFMMKVSKPKILDIWEDPLLKKKCNV